jgi:predicted Ser/Thr protein kinase
MTPHEWARLKQLFHGALEQPASSRRAWLMHTAGGDEDLVREAEALLEVHDTAGTFLEEPIAVAPSDLADVLMPGTQLGAYRIEREIGRGGMGVVYLAEDTRLGRRVAIKSVAPTVSGNDQLRERLRREARAAATIAHPSVAVVYALEEIDNQLLLVTEYVAGRTLRSEIEHGPIPSPRALAIAAEIAQALAAAHDAGVIHRDLKPDNVMLTATDRVKVLDFGIAHIEHGAAPHLTAEGALVGTPAYMAPEQLAGGPVDARTDIHALGTVLFEMIAGRHPMAAEARPAAIAPAVQAIIDRSLQHKPEARYGSAREAVRAIEQAQRAADGDAGPAARRTSARWWWEFHQAVAALVYWLLVIPAWTARGVIGGWSGRAMFIATLTAVVIAANLRLHLWFTSRFYPAELRWLRGRVARWIYAADWLFAMMLIIGSLLIGDESPLAIVLLSFGLGAGVAFLFIETATARAAFKKNP